MATAKKLAFLAPGADHKLKLDDSVTTCPGIGPTMESKLKAHNIHNVGALMGLMMMHNLNKDKFVAAIVVFGGMEERYAREAADALYDKAMQFCSHELPAKVAGTAGQTGSLNTFLNGKLSTQPLKEGYVPGLGKVAAEKLAEAKSLRSTVELMGWFLFEGRSRKKFYDLLVEYGGLRKQDLETNDTDGAMYEKSLQFCR